jgi:predicted ATPase/class 3 adenylate cyclase
MSEERRIVAILFADVTGSTELGDSVDPEDVRALLARYYAIAKEVVDAYGGIVEKFIGDAVMAVFGLPQAHGDDVPRALSAALELRERIRADPALGERVPVRLGVSAGEVVATRDTSGGDFLITGDAVNIAARLQQAAEPWTILCSERAAHAAGAAFTFRPAIGVEAKGKRAPIQASVLIGRAEVPTPERLPLIGRETDLAYLELLARRSLTERRPFLVSLIAPAGTGKTRLVEEFLERLPRLSPDATVAVAQCLPYGQRLTYWPLRSVLFRLAGVGEQADPPTIRVQILRWLVELGVGHPETAAELLAATVGAGESEITDRTALLGAWRSSVEAAARRSPVVLVFEDLHWSSDSLLDLVEFVMQPRGDAAVLMIALTRPELLDRRPGWGGGRQNYASLALEPLTDAETAILIGRLLKTRAPEITARIVARAEGNPFYAGELVRSVMERIAGPDDVAGVERALATLPDTVQATVLARLDLLAPHERRVLQIGAVFGRAFREAGIAALASDLEPALDGVVDQLLAKDLVRPAGADGFAFRHILIREVAYQTLTRAERAQFHAAAGEWLERDAAGRGDALAELIAYHYREAATLGSTSDRSPAPQDSIREKAVRWLARAADVTAAGAATFETVRHLRGAIDLADDENLPELYERLGDVTAEAGISVDAYLQALRLCRERSRPAAQRLRVLASLLTLYMRFQGSVERRPSAEEMEQLFGEGEALLAEVDDERTVARFLIAKGFLPFWLEAPATAATIAEAEAYARRGLEIAARLRDARLQSVALDALASCAIRRRDWRQAREFTRRRLAFEDRLDLTERIDAHSVAAWAACQLGNLDEAIDTAASGLALLHASQVPAQALHLVTWQIYALTLRGLWDDALAAGERGFRLWNEANRFSAGFAVRGFAAALDVARGRRENRLIERYREVIGGILQQLPADAHFARRFEALLLGDLKALDADVVRSFDLLPFDESVERALSFSSDRRYPLDVDLTRAIVGFAEPLGHQVLEAQARRAVGIASGDPQELVRALAIFERIGATPYAARARCEHALLIRDEREFAVGTRALEAIGDVDQLARLEQFRKGAGIR